MPTGCWPRRLPRAWRLTGCAAIPDWHLLAHLPALLFNLLLTLLFDLLLPQKLLLAKVFKFLLALQLQ